jgi:Tfp pilus assembly protein PilF
MRKILVLITAALSFSAVAQKTNVENAAIYLRNLEMEDAKKAIDQAATHPDTKDDPKMWFYRAAIYDTIYRNPDYTPLRQNVEENLVVACLQCLKTDAKKRYEYYCGYAVINGAFAAYNKAIEFYQKKDAANASKFFQYVIDVMPYDKNKDLIKNNINEKSITLTMADLSLKTENYDEAKKHLKKLIDMRYQDPIVYLLMANIHYIQGDTATGLSFTEQGRAEFKSDKDLINQELNIYLAQGKQQVLLNKLNEALEITPDNAVLLFVRGTIYDNYSATNSRNAKLYRDSAAVMNKRAKAQTVPANKTRMEQIARNLNKAADSMTVEKNKYIGLAEADYTRAVENNSDYLDAYYNLGAVTVKKTDEIVEKMNAVTGATQAEYDKKWNALKKDQDAILMIAVGHFEKALAIADNMKEDTPDNKKFKNANLRELYDTLKRVYAQMGDEAKTMEYIKKLRSLD